MQTLAIVPRIVNHSVVSIGILRVRASEAVDKGVRSRRRGEILLGAITLNLVVWVPAIWLLSAVF